MHIHVCICVHTGAHNTLKAYTYILCTVTFHGSVVNHETEYTFKYEDPPYSSLEATCTDITEL